VCARRRVKWPTGFPCVVEVVQSCLEMGINTASQVKEMRTGLASNNARLTYMGGLPFYPRGPWGAEPRNRRTAVVGIINLKDN